MVKWNAQTYSSTVCEQLLMGISSENNQFFNGRMESPKHFHLSLCRDSLHGDFIGI